MVNSLLIRQVIQYYNERKYVLHSDAGRINICYVEGMNPDGTLNRDAPDRWNDLRIVFAPNADGEQVLLHNTLATTEPGRSATFSQAARRRGGVARIAFGQYQAWKMGHHNRHKTGERHPALVQCAPVPVCRDLNRDGFRTGDAVHILKSTLNQHSTRPAILAPNNQLTVGTFSEGCLVGLLWLEHLRFIELCKSDTAYKANPKGFVFHTAILPGDDLIKQTQHIL